MSFDLGAIVIVIPALYALSLLACAALASGTDRTRPHVLIINQAHDRLTDTVTRSSNVSFIFKCLLSGLAATLLLLAEITLFRQFVPAFVADLSCSSVWILYSGCQFKHVVLSAGREKALWIASFSVLLFLTAHISMKRSHIYPLLGLVLAVLIFASLADVVAGPDKLARGNVIFGAIAFLQFSAAIAYFGAMITVSHWTRSTLTTLSLALTLGLITRLSGAVSLLLIWSAAPPAITVALVFVGFLLPGIAASITPIAAVANSNSRPLQGHEVFAKPG